MRNFFVVTNPMERHFLRLLALALMLPTLIIGGCLYYVIFNLMAEQLGIPEIIAYILLPVVERVNTVLLISLPVVFIALFYIGLLLARSLVGPIERLDQELKRLISGDAAGRLQIRKTDFLKPLVDDINVLLDKLEESS